jgi:hypothetical protein
MQLWSKLYNTVWLAFFCCVLLPRWMGPKTGLSVHVLLGVLMLIVTQGNARSLAVLPVPDRLKRISKAVAGFAIFQLVCGLALGGVMHLAPQMHIVAMVLRGIHIVSALAMLSQSSSIATGYDMWEEREFGEAPAQQKIQNP